MRRTTERSSADAGAPTAPPKRSLSFATSILALTVVACGNNVEQEPLRTCQPASLNHLLNTDEEIRSFAGCQVLEGSLQVRSEVTDLSPLSSLIIIEGGISGGGFRSKAFSLDALHNLEMVGEDLHFVEDNVAGFAGLVKLHTVGGWLRLEGVPEIRDLRGLERVRSLDRLDIGYNPKLQTLAGLDGLMEVKGDVWIKGNELVPAEEVDELLARITVGGTIHVD